MKSRRAFLTVVVVSSAVLALLWTTRRYGQRPHCTVICLGFTNAPTGHFVEFAISNSGPVAIEVGHYGTYLSNQRPQYSLPPHVLINRLYDIPPGQWRGFVTPMPIKPLEAGAEVSSWRTEFVYRPAQGVVRRLVNRSQIWLNEMWPNVWTAPTEQRLVFNAVSDWIEEPSAETQPAGAANRSQPIRSDTNRTSAVGGSRR